MPTDKELVVYTRSFGCPYWTMAKKVLNQHEIDYRIILIDRDKEARQRVVDWTGFKSVPTIIVAESGSDLPYTEPDSLSRGQSPKGIDRGAMITEATTPQFESWLRKHGFIE